MSTPASPPLRLAICEDSYAYARGLRRLLESDGTIEVVGVAGTASELLDGLERWKPDLITMDLELPGPSTGLEAIAHIMASSPLPIVVLSAHVGTASSVVTAALAAGALEAIAKSTLRLEGGDAAAAELRTRLIRLAQPGGPGAPAATGAAPPTREDAADSGAPAVPRATVTSSSTLAPGPVPSVIGLVASAGGPRALATVLETLPAAFPIPILLVQHMSAGFTAGLASWLDDTVALPVSLAAAGERLGAGVHVAPDDRHLVLGLDGLLHLPREPAESRHRPAADVLLTSLAHAAGPRALAVVLTGMGRDGAEGVRAVLAAGGRALTESRESAAVWGMPGAAVAEGATPMDLAAIGRALTGLAR